MMVAFKASQDQYEGDFMGKEQYPACRDIHKVMLSAVRLMVLSLSVQQVYPAPFRCTIVMGGPYDTTQDPEAQC